MLQADDRDPDSVVLSVNALRRPGLPSKEYYNNAETVKMYSKTIGLVLEALLIESTPNSTLRTAIGGRLAVNSESLVKDLVSFESKLAAATPSEEEAEDVTQYYNPRSLEETKSLLPQLSIQYIISGLAPSGYTTNRIIVGSPSYLRAVSSILKSTSAETLQAYFVWKTVQHYAYRVEDDALKPLLRFNNELQGKDPDATEERWRTCVKVVDYGLGRFLIRLSPSQNTSLDIELISRGGALNLWGGGVYVAAEYLHHNSQADMANNLRLDIEEILRRKGLFRGSQEFR